MNSEKLQEILEKHSKWIRDEEIRKLEERLARLKGVKNARD